MQHQEEVNRFEKELMRVREERKEAKKQEILKQLTEKRRKEQLAKGMQWGISHTSLSCAVKMFFMHKNFGRIVNCHH